GVDRVGGGVEALIGTRRWGVGGCGIVRRRTGGGGERVKDKTVFGRPCSITLRCLVNWHARCSVYFDGTAPQIKQNTIKSFTKQVTKSRIESTVRLCEQVLQLLLLFAFTSETPWSNRVSASQKKATK